MDMLRCEETEPPTPSLASYDLGPAETKAFLFCAAAGLGGACRGAVYLCNKVIGGVCHY